MSFLPSLGRKVSVVPLPNEAALVYYADDRAFPIVAVPSFAGQKGVVESLRFRTKAYEATLVAVSDLFEWEIDGDRTQTYCYAAFVYPSHRSGPWRVRGGSGGRTREAPRASGDPHNTR